MGKKGDLIAIPLILTVNFTVKLKIETLAYKSTVPSLTKTMCKLVLLVTGSSL